MEIILVRDVVIISKNRDNDSLSTLWSIVVDALNVVLGINIKINY